MIYFSSAIRQMVSKSCVHSTGALVGRGSGLLLPHGLQCRERKNQSSDRWRWTHQDSPGVKAPRPRLHGLLEQNVILNTQTRGFTTHPDFSEVGGRAPRIWGPAAWVLPGAPLACGSHVLCPQLMEGQGFYQGTKQTPGVTA